MPPRQHPIRAPVATYGLRMYVRSIPDRETLIKKQKWLVLQWAHAGWVVQKARKIR